MARSWQNRRQRSRPKTTCPVGCRTQHATLARPAPVGSCGRRRLPVTSESVETAPGILAVGAGAPAPLRSVHGLEEQGILDAGEVHWNLSTPSLYEAAIVRREGVIGRLGPLVVTTGQHTGRSPGDKYVAREPGSEANIWWGSVNRPLEQDRFDALYDRATASLAGQDLFVQDCWAGADPRYRLPLRVITTYAWHSLFARNLFLRATPEELRRHQPAFTILDVPHLLADPQRDGTRSSTVVALNFARRLVLIGGTEYAGEIKKSVFTILNYLLPLQGVLSMHCSANVGQRGDVAIFFGLSGTGKTTLSADPDRTLVGDDEHGWSDQGIFNFEGGCYAKVIKLSREAEPAIYSTTRRFGTVLENVVFDPVTRRLDLDDDSLTENTRAAYPLAYIPNASPVGQTGHPRSIVFLTADAFGVLPPISRLTAVQAMYHFLSGYTARVAGTERGVTEPQATFSACFGAPFLPLSPSIYADLLGEKIERHGAQVWLVNTGWTGGPPGVGHRMPITYTRAMVAAALNGDLASVATRVDPIFGLEVPTACPGVAAEVLDPRSTWADRAAYDEQARRLAAMFAANFEQFANHVGPEVRGAGPRAG
ncbi:MAG: phosphoenolpyruvate carboxykinase [Chloroflexi bacterium]|nr:phosphoenolpyruvate carboxykinase [Chloroflexota bacterium]